MHGRGGGVAQVGFSILLQKVIVKRGNIPLVENPYVTSAWAACFSPPFVCYYSRCRATVLSEDRRAEIAALPFIA